jgi:hypothetical protein
MPFNMMIGYDVNDRFTMEHLRQRVTLTTKIYCSRLYIFAIQLLIYTIYGDRIITGFVGFVVNLPNRPTDSATVSVR